MNICKGVLTERTIKHHYNKTIDSTASSNTIKTKIKPFKAIKPHDTPKPRQAPRLTSSQNHLSPQRRIDSWCKIEQSLMHNIYNLKQQKPLEDREYISSVDKYDQVVIIQSQLWQKVQLQSEVEAGLRDRLSMVKEDLYSKTLRNVDLIAEKEQMEEILEMYVKRFSEESEMVLELIKVEQELRQYSSTLELKHQEMEELEEKVDNFKKEEPKTHHLDRRIHNYRLELMGIEQRINELCEQESRPLLREVMCSFFIKQNKEPVNEMGIELWVCKNNLTSELDRHVYSGYCYLKSECFYQLYLEYLQIMTKIQSNYVEIERVTLQTEAEYQSSGLDHFTQVKHDYEYLHINIQDLREKQTKLKEDLASLHSNEQLFRLQCQLTELDPKRMLRETKTEQHNRVQNIRRVKQRVFQLEGILNKDNVSLKEETRELERKLKKESQKLKVVKQELERSQKERSQKEEGFRDTPNRARTEQSSEELDIAIEALEKKLEKLQNKKQDILNIKETDTPNRQLRDIRNTHQVISPIRNFKKPHKASSKSSSKVKKPPGVIQTLCPVKPWQPIDKAIDRLVTFKKALAVDKARLNKVVTKFMKDI